MDQFLESFCETAFGRLGAEMIRTIRWFDKMGAVLFPCPKCNGRGHKRVMRRQGKGRGRTSLRPCRLCHGTGKDSIF
jgi:hypothetical protein